MKQLMVMILIAIAISVNAEKQKTFAKLAKCADGEDVAVCHRKGQDNFIYKLVKGANLDAHLSHGDFLYKGKPDMTLKEKDDWCMRNIPIVPNNYKP